MLRSSPDLSPLLSDEQKQVSPFIAIEVKPELASETSTQRTFTEQSLLLMNEHKQSPLSVAIEVKPETQAEEIQTQINKIRYLVKLLNNIPHITQENGDPALSLAEYRHKKTKLTINILFMAALAIGGGLTTGFAESREPQFVGGCFAGLSSFILFILLIEKLKQHFCPSSFCCPCGSRRPSAGEVINGFTTQGKRNRLYKLFSEIDIEIDLHNLNLIKVIAILNQEIQQLTYLKTTAAYKTAFLMGKHARLGEKSSLQKCIFQTPLI